MQRADLEAVPPKVLSREQTREPAPFDHRRVAFVDADRRLAELFLRLDVTHAQRVPAAAPGVARDVELEGVPSLADARGAQIFPKQRRRRGADDGAVADDFQADGV